MGNESKYTTPGPHPAVDYNNVDPETVAAYEKSPIEFQGMQGGIAGNRSIEPCPEYRRAPSDVVLKNQRNAWIVLGVDRNSTITSGNGGKGLTQCAAIDLVVGRMGSYVRERDDNGDLIYANPDFTVDAARIYMSQKTNIDDYFRIVDGVVGNSSTKSAIGIKADAVRIIARDGIKLVTKTDSRDSQGGRIFRSTGIDLIGANDDEDMQPLVKGDNLVDALSELVTEIEKIREIVYSFLKYQRSYNQKLLTHTHKSPFYGQGTSPSLGQISQGMQTIIKQTAQTELSIISNQTSLSTWESNYLSPTSRETYICSGYNNTN